MTTARNPEYALKTVRGILLHPKEQARYVAVIDWTNHEFYYGWTEPGWTKDFPVDFKKDTPVEGLDVIRAASAAEVDALILQYTGVRIQFENNGPPPHVGDGSDVAGPVVFTPPPP